jgi:hypothetical protein
MNVYEPQHSTQSKESALAPHPSSDVQSHRSTKILKTDMVTLGAMSSTTRSTSMLGHQRTERGLIAVHSTAAVTSASSSAAVSHNLGLGGSHISLPSKSRNKAGMGRKEDTEPSCHEPSGASSELSDPFNSKPKVSRTPIHAAASATSGFQSTESKRKVASRRNPETLPTVIEMGETMVSPEVAQYSQVFGAKRTLIRTPSD